MYKCHFCGELQWSRTPSKLVVTQVYKALYPETPKLDNRGKPIRGKWTNPGEGLLTEKEERCCPTCSKEDREPEVLGTKRLVTSEVEDDETKVRTIVREWEDVDETGRYYSKGRSRITQDPPPETQGGMEDNGG